MDTTTQRTTIIHSTKRSRAIAALMREAGTRHLTIVVIHPIAPSTWAITFTHECTHRSQQ